MPETYTFNNEKAKPSGKRQIAALRLKIIIFAVRIASDIVFSKLLRHAIAARKKSDYFHKTSSKFKDCQKLWLAS